MKLLNHILAFYLVLLAVVPCCAFDNCPDEKQAIEKTGQHQKGDADNCGNCSPFFNCTGCSSIVIHIHTISITVFTINIQRVYADFIPSFISGVHYDFWQPPRY